MRKSSISVFFSTLVVCLGACSRGKDVFKLLGPITNPYLSSEAPGEWPKFRGTMGDGISREVGLAREWPDEGPRILWQKDLGGGYSSFTVADGRLFTMSKDADSEIVHCWDPSTGKVLWENRYAVRYQDYPTLDPLYFSGPRVSPTVDGDVVYTLGSTGVFKALEVKTGREIWTLDFFKLSGRKDMPKFGYSNTPLIIGNRMYIEPGGQNDRSLACIDKRNGEVMWIRGNYHYGYSSPIYAQVEGKSQIIYFAGNAAVGVDPDTGDELWTYPWETTLDINVATPIFHDGKLFISAAYSMGAALLKLKAKGAPEVVWKKKTMHNYYSTSIFHKGYLYGTSMDRLRCIKFDTGEIVWDKPGLGQGALLMADGMLIYLSENLILADATPEKYNELARWKAFEKIPWNVPVLSGGKLYLRNETKVFAIDAKNP